MEFFEDPGIDILESIEAMLLERISRDEIRLDEKSDSAELTENYEELESLDRDNILDRLGHMLSPEYLKEHLPTVMLIGDLGISAMLLYYCTVLETVAMRRCIEDGYYVDPLVSPSQYLDMAEAHKPRFEIELCIHRTELARLGRLLRYVREKGYRTEYEGIRVDGADVILTLTFYAALGFELKSDIRIEFDTAKDASDFMQSLVPELEASDAGTVYEE